MRLNAEENQWETASRVHGIFADKGPVYRSLKAAITITTELILESPGRVERQRSPVCAKTDPNSPEVSSPEPLVSLTITLAKPTRQVYAENAA
jgi:hypothetical protein